MVEMQILDAKSMMEIARNIFVIGVKQDKNRHF